MFDEKSGNCSTSLVACWRAAVIQHHCIGFICPKGNDGSIDVTLSYVQTRTWHVPSGKNVKIPISWGESILEGIPSGAAVQWIATYRDFNNRVHHFGSSNSAIDSPYLRVKIITDSALAFTAFPFGSGAGMDLSTIANESSRKALRDLGVRDETNLNVMTKAGFRNLKEAALLNVGNAIPNSHVDRGSSVRAIARGVIRSPSPTLIVDI